MIERHVYLLRLLSQQDDFKPASFYSDKLSVSTKTIYQDIDLLKEYVANFHIQIERLPSVGIKLHGNNEDIQTLLVSAEKEIERDVFSPEKRRVEMIRQVLFGNKQVTLEYFSTIFMVSKTSLYNDLKLINKIIEVENVQFVSTNNGIEISGTEATIQKAIKQLVFYYRNELQSKTFRQILEMLFDKYIVNQVYELLFNEYSELTEKVSDYYVRSLVSTIVIQCNRLLKGHHMTAEVLFKERYEERRHGTIDHSVEEKQNQPMSKTTELNQTKTFFIHEQLNELERLFRMIEQQKMITIEEDYRRLKRYERQAEYDEEVRQI